MPLQSLQMGEDAMVFGVICASVGALLSIWFVLTLTRIERHLRAIRAAAERR